MTSVHCQSQAILTMSHLQFKPQIFVHIKYCNDDNQKS